MRGSTAFWVVIILAVICALLGVYYLVPGVYHVATLSCNGDLTCIDGPQPKHVILFFALAVVLLIASRFAWMRATAEE